MFFYIVCLFSQKGNVHVSGIECQDLGKIACLIRRTDTTEFFDALYRNHLCNYSL